MILRSGDIFNGRYEVIDKLGRGVLKTVYLAKDNLGREVALNVMNRYISSDGVNSMHVKQELNNLTTNLLFEKEKKIHMPVFVSDPINITKIMLKNKNNKKNLDQFLMVYELNEKNNPPYFVNEFFEGCQTLRKYLVDDTIDIDEVSATGGVREVRDELGLAKERKQLVSPEDVVEKGEILKINNPYVTQKNLILIAKQVAKGISTANEAGVYHKDLNLGNILVRGGTEIEVKVIDFGIAKTSDGLDGKTTLLLRSYEEMKIGHFDDKSQVWALGVLFYRMFTGTYPFLCSKSTEQGNRRDEIKSKILSDKEAILPRLINQKIYPDIEKIIVKSLTKDPSKRIASARELYERISYATSFFGRINRTIKGMYDAPEPTLI